MTTNNTDRWLTFDCYGTLVDWRAGMESALCSVAPDHVQELLAGYHRAEPELELRRPLLPYREVLRLGLETSGRENGIALTSQQTNVLADTMASWPVFPETGRVLQQLRDLGWRLAILSNVDDEIIAGTLQQLGDHFDEVITSQQVGSYKPDLGHFETFRSRCEPGAWLHVACSWVHDVEPATSLGTPTVFVNRENEAHDTSRVAATLSDLTGLPDNVQDQFHRIQEVQGALVDGNLTRPGRANAS